MLLGSWVKQANILLYERVAQRATIAHLRAIMNIWSFRLSRATNSTVSSKIWLKIEPIQCIICTSSLPPSLKWMGLIPTEEIWKHQVFRNFVVIGHLVLEIFMFEIVNARTDANTHGCRLESYRISSQFVSFRLRRAKTLKHPNLSFTIGSIRLNGAKAY